MCLKFRSKSEKIMGRTNSLFFRFFISRNLAISSFFHSFIPSFLNFLILSFFLSGCEPKVKVLKDNPDNGEINFSIDETLRPFVDAQLDVFSNSFPRTKINRYYKTQNECISDLVNDSAQLICIGRALDTTESKILMQKKFAPPVFEIALDAIALISNNDDKDSVITTEQIRKILNGEVSNKRLVFDKSNSSTVNFLMDYYKITKLPANAFATESNAEAIKYVSENKNAIGVIGWCWLSDSDDPFTKKSLEHINVLGIKTSSQKVALKPYQVNLADKQYPFFRSVYLYPREHGSNLACSFANFADGDIGQTIILKAGVVPRHPPVRMLEFKDGNVGKVKN